ncbi:MAG TPA: hypothetical protein VGR87_05105 [Candidatus Limnocylindria bacterium]|jgi:hypothetical protein|nr:hypothetical protein [Candidatus Limnocylindria bacterium]
MHKQVVSRASRRFGALVVLASLALVLLGPGQVALAADPGSGRSCMGHEARDISPPGSNTEFPGGAPGLRKELGAIAESLGIPVGRIYALIASLHEGSHEACDEALEG